MRRVGYALRSSRPGPEVGPMPCAHHFLSQRRQATKQGRPAIWLMSRRAQLENNAARGLCAEIGFCFPGPGVKPVATVRDNPSDLSGFVPL